MKAEQLSIFVENRAGKLSEIIHLLGINEINIRALSLADTSDFGILRMIVCDQEKAIKILKEHGFTLGKAAVIAVELPDKPGALDAILQLMSANGINVEYMYACARRNHNDAIMIFRFDKIDQAIGILTQNNHVIVPGAQLCLI